MNRSAFILWAVAATLVSSLACAGEVTVKWQDPAKYTDIDPGESDKAKFEESLFKSFNTIFAGLAQKLPDNVRWEVTVTDLDLAGEVLPSMHAGGQELRRIWDNTPPAISFEYKLLDADGKSISQAKVDLKDVSFMARSPDMIGLTIKSFPYEEFMIDQWFAQQQAAKIFPVR